ncbi:MAG TPA: hypothetical protein VGP88_00870, partial [Thermoplasmata archaeon]|nr:hypothetical protein [Thermoplasmata archaeon]
MAAAPRLRRAAAVAIWLAAVLAVPAGLAAVHAPPAAALSTSFARSIPACARCVAPVGSSGRVSAAPIDWQNVTPEQFGDLPPASTGASMAYDVADREAVWFGGCPASGCASNETWLYRNASWTNDTRNLTVAPAPRSGAMMDYDPNARAAVLFGGHVEGPSAGNQFTNDTWEFARGTWTRIPNVCAANAVACLNPQSEASFAFDANRSVNASVLFG